MHQIEEIAKGIGCVKKMVDQKKELLDIKEIEFVAYKEYMQEEIEEDSKRLKYLEQCYLETAGECFICGTHATKKNNKWICKQCNCED